MLGRNGGCQSGEARLIDRVASVNEFKARILKGIDEFNASPVVFRWTRFDLGVV